MIISCFISSIARFFSSSTCIVNNGLGIVFLTIGAVAMLIYRSKLLQVMNMIMIPADIVICLGVLAVAMMAGMVVPTSSSVSLEGKSIWVIQSMPASPAQVLLAKLKFCLTLFLPPVLLFMLTTVFVFGASFELGALAVVAAVATVVVMAEIGLISNVNHPLLNWTSETQAVKSGSSVLISMLIDMVIVFTVGFGGYLMLDKGVSAEMTLMIFAVVMLLAARLLYGIIIRSSARKFAFLS